MSYDERSPDVQTLGIGCTPHRIVRAVAPAAKKFIPTSIDPGLLLAIGDSWFAYWPQGDALDVLKRKHRFEVETSARAGVQLQQLADQRHWLLNRIRALLPEQARRLRAVLVSGGGNDLAGNAPLFQSLLNPAGLGVPELKEAEVAELVDRRLRATLQTIFDEVTLTCESALDRKVPIIVHGYDYPIPDDRGAVLDGPWLHPTLTAMGYGTLQQRQDVMKQLIDRFNTMLIALVNEPQYRHVKHVDLRGTLFATPDLYRRHWQNELHPTIPTGFDLVADRFARGVP